MMMSFLDSFADLFSVLCQFVMLWVLKLSFNDGLRSLMRIH